MKFTGVSGVIPFGGNSGMEMNARALIVSGGISSRIELRPDVGLRRARIANRIGYGDFIAGVMRTTDDRKRLHIEIRQATRTRRVLDAAHEDERRGARTRPNSDS